MNAPRLAHPDAERTRLRTTVATIELALARLPSWTTLEPLTERDGVTR